MKSNISTITQERPLPRMSAASSGIILQRQCACGRHTIAGSTCAECGSAQLKSLSTLSVSRPDDEYEREAQSVARRVMSPNRDTASTDAGNGARRRPLPPAAPRTSYLSGGQPLPQAVRAELEPRFGADFSAVRIHADGRASSLARSLRARAFTVGSDVVFRKGAYSPATASGRSLLAHELAHVVQQSDPAPAVAPMIQRTHELDTSAATMFATPSGNFFRFATPAARTNHTDRPRFIHPASVMVTYSGTGSNGSATVHPAVTTALNNFMSALRTEGNRIDDESMKQAVVGSGFRASTASEGRRYLSALRKTIRENPDIFGALTFPASLEATAQSELGTSGSAAHRAFVTSLAAQPGWNRTLAQRLVDITARFKAPRGGSTHHSGLVVDINFPYATSASAVAWHGMDRNLNANARRAAAGVWLDSFSRDFDFDSYSTSAEIWHQEWRSWAGTAADPAQATSAAGSAAGTTAAGEETEAEEAPEAEGSASATAAPVEPAAAAPASPAAGAPGAPATAAPATPAAATPAAPTTTPTAASGPTSDSLLNEWLAIHTGDHLSSDLTWILSQWPAGGSLNDLNAGFRANVQALQRFVAANAGASFTIISFARSPQKQHVMHVAQYIRRNLVSYNNYRFSQWAGLLSAGGRSTVAAQDATTRAATLTAVNNPEALDIVWDTGTLATSRKAASAIAGSSGYGIGATNPVANGGATYAWPTGNTGRSRHGTGNAVDADPVSIPNQVVIRRNEAVAWPDLATARTALGAGNVAEEPATAATATSAAQQAGYRISGLSDIARRDAFLELFFHIRSAARAGFTDPNHFQAP